MGCRTGPSLSKDLCDQNEANHCCYWDDACHDIRLFSAWCPSTCREALLVKPLPVTLSQKPATKACGYSVMSPVAQADCGPHLLRMTWSEGLRPCYPPCTAGWCPGLSAVVLKDESVHLPRRL
jgi:hypothetical protein